jgi:hypothetical protein
MSTNKAYSKEEQILLQKIASIAGQINRQKNAINHPAKIRPYTRAFTPKYKSLILKSLTPLKTNATQQKYLLNKGGNKLTISNSISTPTARLRLQQVLNNRTSKFQNKFINPAKAQILKRSKFQNLKTLELVPSGKSSNSTTAYLPNRLTVDGITFTKSNNGNSLVRSKTETKKAIARYATEFTKYTHF